MHTDTESETVYITFCDTQFQLDYTGMFSTYYGQYLN